MGLVFRAFDETLHRVVAIKVMAPQLAASASARQRFTREARAQAAVAHEHVVTIHAVEEANGLPYIVMQCVGGLSLQDRLDKFGPLPVAEVLRIGMQAAGGLAAAHAQGLVHRDVKPANILLENGVERVKLTDFGLARAADDASLTQSGQVAGTPMYMSPEQAEGTAVDARSDLFSLGSALYAMCTGRPPFRAGTSMAVLRRVCDDEPTPIREVNPEVPDSLAEIIAKLHSKNPADRFQSAAEVADLLGRHLAHVQHPSIAPLPASVKPTARPKRGWRRHWWATAAAVLLMLAAGLGTTEATGVTKVRSTVVRLFTPEGTLVVETDDPAVKVVVEGDGDLVITGAGPQEVRLRAGSYRLRATKDGKPVNLDHDLVTITRGDREIVKVRLEGQAAATGPPKGEKGAFVALGRAGVAERRFDNLEEAVAAADHGDIIEIRGDGPFETDGVEVLGRALVIRAGPGRRPVLSLSARGRAEERPIVLGRRAALTLEGLTLQRIGRSPTAGSLIVSEAAPLRVANCRFAVKDNNAVALWATLSPTLDVRNCVVLGSRNTVVWSNPKEGSLSMDNCQLATSNGILFNHAEPVQKIDLRLTRNTFVGGDVARLVISAFPDFFTAGIKPQARRIHVEAENNVFDADCMFCATQHETLGDRPLPAERFKTLVTDLVGWRGRNNLHIPSAAFLGTRNSGMPGGHFDPLVGHDQLAEWRRIAGPEAGTPRGKAVFVGGELYPQATTTPERLLPRHFGLQPRSPGSRAGKDGRDLGADAELVGPGEAYERWKTTPAYQEWLKATDQKK
jgi:hypothetical protein